MFWMISCVTSVMAPGAQVNLHHFFAQMSRACSTIANSAGHSYTPGKDGNFTSLWSRKALTDQEPFHLGGKEI